MKPLIFLDSGAYSAWTNKSSVDVYEYMDFIDAHRNEIEVYACLDDIESPDKTWQNQRLMEQKGFKPLPVWHVNEPDSFLEMAMEYDYFAVGGMALKSLRVRRESFIRVFKKICTEKTNFYPSHKIHGFGLASPDLLVSYPWYSVDTTSWVMYGRYGLILVPQVIDQTLRYDKPPYSICVSTRSKEVTDRMNWKAMSEDQRRWLTAFCESKGFSMGVTSFKEVPPGYKLKKNENFIDKKKRDIVEVVEEEGLFNNSYLRDDFNLLYFLDLEKNQPEWPWRWKPDTIGIFD